MPATARRITITEEQLAAAKGGNSAYAQLEVPADYVGVLKDVTDFDNRDRGGAVGWKFHYDVEGLDFNEAVSVLENSRWKLLQVFEAHGVELPSGSDDIDPNPLIGTEAGVHIDFPPEYYKAPVEGKRYYKEIRYLFPLAPEEAPEELVGPAEEGSQLDQRLAAEEPETF